MESIKVPHEEEAEAAVIGCIFMDENIIVDVQDRLGPDDFYFDKNKIIYKAMLDLFNKGTKVEPLTVISYLSNKNLLENVGGVEYLDAISNISYSLGSVDTYVDLIVNSAVKRNAINTLNKLVQQGYDPANDVNIYLENVEKDVFELSKRKRAESLRDIADVADAVFKRADENSRRKTDLIGLDTGYRELNRYTQGFQNGALIILAARPGAGKSAFALNLAMNIASRNKGGAANVAIFSLEMSAEQLVERIIANESSIKLGLVKSGMMNQQEWVRFNTTVEKIKNVNLYFDDSSGLTIQNIRAKCRKLKSEGKVDFIIIDYLQLISGTANDERISEQEKIAKISRNLKLMARELEVPVLALSQLSREVDKREDKRPVMSDLRSSGAIEQDADIIMFLYRKDKDRSVEAVTGETDLLIEKNRSGSSTRDGIHFIFTGEYQSFKEKKED